MVLVALNAKYVHTNLALRYVRAGIRAEFPDVLLKEFTINESVARIAAEIFETEADVIGFSCYIWNITETLALIRRLRPVCTGARFVVGGPEVSFEADRLLHEHREIDAVVPGEGEISFLRLLEAWRDGRDPDKIPGLVWRREDQIIINPGLPQPVKLERLPAPYQEQENLAERIAYVETSRGCPFNCQYCLSSTFTGVRYLEPERFREIFRRIMACGSRTIKFVDRTFNADKQHAFRVLDIVREEAGGLPDSGVRVHCEMAGDLLDDEWLTYLKSYPAGLIQLEIGVQSTHRPTLELVRRPQHFGRWQKYVIEIVRLGIHLHLDLIAGLPAEDWAAARISFNDVYAAGPDMLQLGFLKVLKGCGLRQRAEEYGLAYSPDPPYTVLSTNCLSHPELLRLFRLETVLDKYYNSGKFRYCLTRMVSLFAGPFEFYDTLAGYWQERGWFRQSYHGKALFDRLWDFVQDTGTNWGSEEKEILRDALRFDFYLWERPGQVPGFLETDPGLTMEQIARVRYDPLWAGIIPEYAGMDKRQWARRTAVAYFPTGLAGPDDEAAGGTDKAPAYYLFVYGDQPQAYRYRGSVRDARCSSECLPSEFR